MKALQSFWRKKNPIDKPLAKAESERDQKQKELSLSPSEVEAALEAEKLAASIKANAAVTIQACIRRYLALQRVTKRSLRVWDRVFDARLKRYFWFNNINGKSQYNVPRLLILHPEADLKAAVQFERVVRGFIGRMRGRHKAHLKYTRFFDANEERFYWMVNTNKETFWDASKWLIRQECPMPPEDSMLYKSYLRIKDLEAQLRRKDEEIKEVRVKRYEELEPEILVDKVKSAKDLVRSKHMDTWTTDQLAAWFTEMKMDEYISFLFQNRVDGNLFVNLSSDEYADIGIVNKFHLRKLEIIMRAYQTRYQLKKNRRPGEEYNDDDELLSDYSPSELSDIIGHEHEDDDDDQGDEMGDEGDDYVLTEEEQLQKMNEERNVSVTTLVQGDEENYPMVGDVVRVRYTCSTGDGKMITSTKAGMQLASIEFVLGLNQVIKGFDVALPQMSVGERAKLRIAAEFAYGKPGLPPIIPPNTELIFDLTLLGFRQRLEWQKPLIQEPGLSEKPYLNPDGSGNPYINMLASIDENSMAGDGNN